jgi:hypothetical protein
MAPEQASGRSKEIGPACDTYALGAILYECLTGRPPFRAATMLETLQQVVSEEPVPPRLVNPQVPVDLETVCLKCLHKEAERRYGSALALAEDLHRYQQGEPIKARPVGRLERTLKWMRRNPALAALSAAVLMVLLIGSGVSAGFAVVASQEAEKARESAEEALARGKELTQTNSNLTRTAGELKRSSDQLKGTATELERSHDDLEAALARRMVRPLALNVTSQPWTHRMTEREWEVIRQLANHRDGRLGFRFVQEASKSALSSRQLRDRATLALHAAVGLDEQRRDEVEALLLLRMNDPRLTEVHRTDLALAAARWDAMSRPAASQTAQRLIRALKETRDISLGNQLAECVAALSARLESREASHVAQQGASAMIEEVSALLRDTREWSARNAWEKAFAALVSRLEPTEASMEGASKEKL